jgi:hypothetical protein
LVPTPLILIEYNTPAMQSQDLNTQEARQVGILVAEWRAPPLVPLPPAVSSLLARFALLDTFG